MANMTKDDWVSLFPSGTSKPSAAPTSAPIAASADPDEVRKQQWLSIFNAPMEKESTPWSSVGAQAFTNIPQSAYKYGKDLYEAVTSPVETMQGLGSLTKAAINAITPDVIAKWLYDPKEAEKAGKIGTAVADFYLQRYGTVENFKQSLAKDPVGVMGDLSTILNIGGGAAKMATVVPQIGEQGKVAALAKRLSGASQVTDPLMLTGKVSGTVASNIAGTLSGTGPTTVRGAAKAGFEGDQNFLNALRGNTPATQALDNAKYNLEVMRENRANAYRSGMVDIKNDKTILDLTNIEQKLIAADKANRLGSKVLDETAQKIIDSLKAELNDWNTGDPTIFRTPEGLDKLKQRIGSITGQLDPRIRGNANASRIGTDIYNSVKQTIGQQAPTYAKVMSDYAEASDTLLEIERALFGGNRSSADTAMRRLQSITRNNANTNYGNRLSLAQTLEKEGGKPFISMLEGQAMNAEQARGLAGLGQNLSMMGGVVQPGFWATLPLQIPRVVGETTYLGGRAAKAASAPFRAIGADAQDLNTLATLVRPQMDQTTNQAFTPISLSDLYQQMISR